MTDRPILFSGEMVRAILDGRKTQTRRIVKPQPVAPLRFCIDRPAAGGTLAHFAYVDVGGVHHNELSVDCPYGQPGDRLWVREAWGAVSPHEDMAPLAECKIEYRADLPPHCTDQPGQWPADEARGNPQAPHWRPSIFMRREASRITLEVVAVRVERVQDISEDDAEQEGKPNPGKPETARDWFCRLWDKINGKRAPWPSNPWVWVVEFKRVFP